MAALSPLDPTRPSAAQAVVFNSRTFFDLNWLPRSECTIVRSGDRNAIALRNADARQSGLHPRVVEWPDLVSSSP